MLEASRIADLEARVAALEVDRVQANVIELDPMKSACLVINVPDDFSYADVVQARHAADQLRELGIKTTIIMPARWQVRLTEADA